MKDLISKYERKAPELVFEWKDSQTEAEGWVVINSLRGGAAGGGTRMRKGLDKREVESLAKTMEVKFTVSGPPIGGAKSGINFDPSDPRKEGVLRRWFQAVAPLIKNYYGTGGDLNIDEINEVIPICETLGISHPQEGVLVGHFKPGAAEKAAKIGQLRTGVSKMILDAAYSPTPGKQYVIADMITGYGVAESVRHHYSIYGKEIRGKRALIQGWGNVGAAAGYYLAQMGVHLSGIIDRNGGLISEEGFDFDSVKAFFLNRKSNQLHEPHLIPFARLNEEIWDHKTDIFVPAAASRLVTAPQIKKLLASGCEVIACGANVPFADPEIFFGPTGELADAGLSVIPDFISNCGMARVFAYLMQDQIGMNDRSIFEDVSKTILEAQLKTHALNSTGRHLAKTGFEIALNQLI